MIAHTSACASTSNTAASPLPIDESRQKRAPIGAGGFPQRFNLQAP